MLGFSPISDAPIGAPGDTPRSFGVFKPNVLYAMSGLTGAYTDIDDSPGGAVAIEANVGSASASSVLTWTVTLPTWTLRANDWIVVFASSSAGSTTPTAEPHNNGEGYTLVGRIRNTFGCTLGVYIKEAVAGDVASMVSITYGTAQVQALSAVIVRNSSGLGGSVWNPTANAGDATTSTTDLSSFTPTNATGSLIAGVIATRRTGTAPTPTISTPTGYTEVRTDYTANPGTSTNLGLKIMRDTDGTYASPTGTADITLGNTVYDVTLHFEMLNASSIDGAALVPSGGAIEVRIGFEDHATDMLTLAGDQILRVAVKVP